MCCNNYAEIINNPVEDETENTPLILALKYFTSSSVDILDLTRNVNLEVIKLLIEFGKLIAKQ